MNYRVIIAPAVIETIASWGLPREVLLEVYNRLHINLRANPDAELAEQVVPYANMFTYPLAVELTGLNPFSFVFFVRRNQGDLQIVAARYNNPPDYELLN